MHRSLVCCPWDALTIQAQSQIYTNFTTIGMMKELELKGLAAGWQINWLRDVPAAMLWFPLYTWLNANVANICRSPLECCIIAGLSSGLAATLVAAPAEVIKTYLTSRQEYFARQQAQQQAASWIDTLDAKMPSVKEAARKLLAEDGFGGLFAGTGSRMAKMIPSMAVNVGSYNVMKTAAVTGTLKTLVPIAPTVMYAELSLAGGNVVVLSPTPEVQVMAAVAAATATSIPSLTAEISNSPALSSATDAFTESFMAASASSVGATSLSSTIPSSMSVVAAAVSEQAGHVALQMVQESTIAGSSAPQIATDVAEYFETSQNFVASAALFVGQAAISCPHIATAFHEVSNMASSIPALIY